MKKIIHFRPKPDITVVELAEIVRTMVQFQPFIAKEVARDIKQKKIPIGVRRHFDVEER